MTRRELRQLSTLAYFLPRPASRTLKPQVTLFLHTVAAAERGVVDFRSPETQNWYHMFDEARLHEWFGECGLGILSWRLLKNGKRQYIVDLDRVKELVKQRIDDGIKTGDEHILSSLHFPDYGCYMLPLKRIFPEYKSVMRSMWRRAWSAGYQTAERDIPRREEKMEHQRREQE
jgi:hypothetical protein